MPRRIRADHPEHELRNAEIRTARVDYGCDLHGCGAPIPARTSYAYINTGIKVCREHFEPADIVETPT